MDLYLNIISDGLLQLLRQLDSEYESIKIDVLIAERAEKTEDDTRIVAKLDDYKNYIKNRIEEKKRWGLVRLNKDTEWTIDIGDARTNPKLQIVDFVCYTKFKYNSRKKQAKGKKDTEFLNLLENLYDNDLLFSTEANSMRARIECMLSETNIADAVIEYYLALWNQNSKILDRIINCISNTNYRILKSQMKTLSREITSYVERMDDYELSEEFLKKLHSEFVERLKQTEAPYVHLDFNIELMLADCYLREGDTPMAHDALEECRKILDQSDYSMEELFLYYQLQEKEALLALDEYDYDKAVAIMEKTGGFLKELMSVAGDNKSLDRFNNVRSEYYGDVLCMQLLAMMPLQRINPDLYGEMVKLSDIALTQYPANEAELERHRQYRSFIEMEHGNCEDGLRWFAKSKCFDLKNTQKDSIKEVLDLICSNEAIISCQWYLMYYLLILEKASECDHDLADRMYQALIENEKLLRISEIESSSPASDKTIFLGDTRKDSKGIIYHPVDTNLWKWGTYKWTTGNQKDALTFVEKAFKACFQNKEDMRWDREGYLAMNIRGVAIGADYLRFLFEREGAMKAKKLFESIINKIDGILTNPGASEAAKKLVDQMKEKIKSSKKNDGYDVEILMEVGRMIPY
ncbi:MAG: hypothetical protein K6E85_17000 [Lachnospiraceae bacterium]|nr:hypothetical protein [Lachnospiraceae bacterium]